MTSYTAATAAVSLGGYGAWKYQHQHSLAVQQWRPSQLSHRRAGPLHVRHGGSGEQLVVLLHGLVATGEIFGRPFDKLTNNATVVVPDLLGFGRSLDETKSRFTPEHHLDALDQMLADLDLAGRPMTLGAHSMGSALALRWAERLGAQVQNITCFGAPMYPTASHLDSELRDAGLMTSLFVANTKWAETACALSCRHRQLSGRIATALSPTLPTPITKASSLHTWPAYRDAMDELVANTAWRGLYQRASDQGTELRLIWGDADRIGDIDFVRTFAQRDIEIVPDATHHIPLTHPELCIEFIAKRRPEVI